MNGGHQPSMIPKKRKQTGNKQFSVLEKDIADYEGRCLFAADDNGAYCDEPVDNNCHIVSESAVLTGLRDDKTKKVLQLQWGISQWRRMTFSSNSRKEYMESLQDPTTFDPSERTTHDACVGWFACKPHDNEFQPIDVPEPDFDNPVVRFLAAYRSVLFEVDLGRQGLMLHPKWDQKAIRNSVPVLRTRWFGTLEKLRSRLRKEKSTMALLGKHWYAGKTLGTFDPNIVSAQVLEFRSKLRLAGCVSYKATYVSIFPAQGDCHRMGVLYLTGESDLAGEALERLAEVARDSEKSDNYGVTVTAELMKNGSGAFAVSPKSYEGLDDRDRSTIQNLVKEHTLDEELIKSIVRQSSGSRRRRK